MNQPDNQINFQPLKVNFWVVWFSLTAAVLIYPIFLGSEPPESGTINAFMLIMLIVPSLVSLFCRWVILPKTIELPTKYIVLIIGMATGEVLSFFGYFLFPYYQKLFFFVSLAMVVQFMPIYLHKQNASLPRVKDMSKT